MVKKFLRKKSKIVPAKRRYRIAKRVREHYRKETKLNKRKEHKSVNRKDAGIPNKFPFKDTLIHDEQKRRERAEDIMKAQKENRFDLLAKLRGISLEEDTSEQNREFQELQNEVERLNPNDTFRGYRVQFSLPQLTTYYKEFQKVVASADVVLEVLDARDPLGCRCQEVEKLVIRSNKRLVLVLNKIDLIPSENCSQWLKYLRNEFPTVSFKAATLQRNTQQLKRKWLNSNGAVPTTTACVGAKLLMKLLGNYCRNKGLKTSIRVGIVGYPNVGKSSIVNSLKRAKACSVGATPGVTKVKQEVHLDKHITLLDSPGIVLAKGNGAAAALKNAMKSEQLEDPIPVVEEILNRVPRIQIMKYYKLPQFRDVDEFLNLVAMRFGFYKKGGILKSSAAAHKLIDDWNRGNLKYFTVPPENTSLPSHISAKIVSEMAKEFDLDALESVAKKDKMIMRREFHPVNSMQAMEIPSSGISKGCVGLSASVQMPVSIVDGIEHTLKSNWKFPVVSEKKKRKIITETLDDDSKAQAIRDRTQQKLQLKPKQRWNERTGLTKAEAAIKGNQRVNAERKRAFKLLKKKRSRLENRKEEQPDQFSAELDMMLLTNKSRRTQEADDYDFNVDF